MEDRRELASILANRVYYSLLDQDVLAWGPNPKGKYTIALGYHVLDKQALGNAEVPWWKNIWNKFSWPKCNFFSWLVVYGKYLTWDNLCKRGFQGPSVCFLCLKEVETVSHLFFQCPFARTIWIFWWWVWNLQCRNPSSLDDFWWDIGPIPMKNLFLHIAWPIGPNMIIWNIWLECNREIF